MGKIVFQSDIFQSDIFFLEELCNFILIFTKYVKRCMLVKVDSITLITIQITIKKKKLSAYDP